MPESLPGDEVFRDLITPEGELVDEVLIPNPYTGEIHRIGAIAVTRYNADSGRPEALNRKVMLIGADGTPLVNVEDIVFCAACFQPVAKQHTVIDPFCGKTLCLMHSQMVDINGTNLRICSDCAKAIRKNQRWQAIKNFLLGRSG